jgi:hypothetical protein
MEAVYTIKSTAKGCREGTKRHGTGFAHPVIGYPRSPRNAWSVCLRAYFGAQRFGKTYHSSTSKEETRMLRKLAKVLGFAVAVLFVVSTLAMAQTMSGTVGDGGKVMGADGKEMMGAMAPAGTVKGDKVSCEKTADGKMSCKKAM